MRRSGGAPWTSWPHTTPTSRPKERSSCSSGHLRQKAQRIRLKSMRFWSRRCLSCRSRRRRRSSPRPQEAAGERFICAPYTSRVRRVRRVTRKLDRRRKAETHGRRSETLAAVLLACKFYRVLGRRVKTRAGGLDLIAMTPSGVLCFVEVKARGSESDAAEAVTARQRARIARAAALYLGPPPTLRHQC